MGRPSKGERVKTTLRLPLKLAQVAQSHFSEQGGNLNDYVVELLQERFADQLANAETPEETKQPAA